MDSTPDAQPAESSPGVRAAERMRLALERSVKCAAASGRSYASPYFANCQPSLETPLQPPLQTSLQSSLQTSLQSSLQTPPSTKSLTPDQVDAARQYLRGEGALHDPQGNIIEEGPRKRKAPAPVPPKPTKQIVSPYEHAMRERASSIAGENGVELSDEQRAVLLEALLGHSIFFTGAAGTGKSVLLRAIMRALSSLYGPDAVSAAASTGAAAFGIGGVTLHSFFGIGLGDKTTAELVAGARKNWPAIKRLEKINHLVVDEISMISAELWDKFDAVARELRTRAHIAGARSQPFGGLQLIVSGDFCQLPPIFHEKAARENDSDSDAAPPDHRLCFEANCWKSLFGNRCYELRTIFRQRDTALINILNEMRAGFLSPHSRELLERCRPRADDKEAPVSPTQLRPRNNEVDAINARRLDALPGACLTYTAVDSVSNKFYARMLEHSRLPPIVRLKVGAQVVLLRNMDVEMGLVNGAVGLVTALTPSSATVQFALRGALPRCVTATISAIKEEYEAYGVPVCSRTQIPFRLAWALTSHRAQGMTIEYIDVQLNRVFEQGQAYVMLSRATSLEGIRIIGSLPPDSMLEQNKHVMDFNKSLRAAVW